MDHRGGAADGAAASSSEHPQAAPSTQVQSSMMAEGPNLRNDATGTILVDSSSSDGADGGNVTYDEGATCTDMEVVTTTESGELTHGGGRTFYEPHDYSAASEEPDHIDLDALDQFFV